MKRTFTILALAVLAGIICAKNCPAQQMIRAVQISPARPIQTPDGRVIISGVPQEAGVPLGLQPGQVVSGAVAAGDRQQMLNARLQRLAQLKFSRLPSAVLESWAKQDYLTEKERENISDLAPAPPNAFLYNDERFDIAIKKLQYDVTLGNWNEVAKFLDLLPEKEAAAKTGDDSAQDEVSGEPNDLAFSEFESVEGQVGELVESSIQATPPTNAIQPAEIESPDSEVKSTNLRPQATRLYRSILNSLVGNGDRQLPGNNGASSQSDSRAFQNQYLTFADVFAIGKMAPHKLASQDISTFGRVFANIVTRNGSSEDLVRLLQQDLEEKSPVFSKREVAKILFGAGNSIAAGMFLPELDEATRNSDFEALNLLSQYHLAIHARDNKTEALDRAWMVTQAILAAKNVKDAERKTALQRAVSLSGKVSKDLRSKWLTESFEQSPERGIEALSSIGSDTARSMLRMSRSATSRLDMIKLQSSAVESFFETNPKDLEQWQQALEILAQNWLREAQVSYTDDQSGQLGPGMQRDMYGNIFYYNNFYQQQQQRPNRLSPISIGDLLKVKPSERWLAALSDSIKPKFDMIQAQLYLKAGEESLALPFIEKLANTYPEQTKLLVDEFMRVWTKNHDPNSAQRRTNSYMYMYGYESRAESIPLTRSKQLRNLEELAELIPKLNNMIEDSVDQDLVLEAFIACHSTAEVYQIAEIEQVFGKVDKVKPEIFAQLAQRMRSNLAQLWRDANVQKDKKTKRNKKDIREEVMRGYEIARAAVDDGLKRNPDDWSLMVVDAALIHDANNYRSEFQNSSEFSPTRGAAMKRFQQAAENYVAKVDSIEEKDYSTEAFETWFYASLGACDLGLIDKSHSRDAAQTKLVHDTINKMPEEAREWHMGRFANLLFNRLSSVKPELKYRYLDAGFEIVGENEQALEARKVHDYYMDLVTEIQLQSKIDGNAEVGQQPFGVFVNIKHTKQIERESGGFGRYLQNQNGSMSFSYNYGRPTEDYRDKFDEACRNVLDEHFEVLSITFQTPEVKSVPLREADWRETPYAYLLLKARGPEVDQLPPLKLDLDFLDTSGYAILPIESPMVLLDASGKQTTRPHQNLAITQILDERQAAEGKLILEIKATSSGLVPELADIMKLDLNPFEVSAVDDQGVSVEQFDEESDENVVVSSRNWLVSLTTDKELDQKPKTFDFPVPMLDTKEVVYQRYVDADLATVEASVSLEEKYGKTSYGNIVLWIVGGLTGTLFLIGLLVLAMRSVPKTGSVKANVPENPNPFFVISMLQNVRDNNGLNEKQKNEIGQSINRLEHFYFGNQESDDPEPDLGSLIQKWSKRMA